MNIQILKIGRQRLTGRIGHIASMANQRDVYNGNFSMQITPP
jgi:hypothetical protein